MEGVICPEEAVAEEDIYGINNAPLFSLGVALLEIAHWKSLEDQKIPRDSNIILTARRLGMRNFAGWRGMALGVEAVRCPGFQVGGAFNDVWNLGLPPLPRRGA